MRWLIGFFLIAGMTPNAPLSRVLSYGRNFAVFSSDPAVASWTAREAERIRERILTAFHWRQPWRRPLVIDADFSGSPPTPTILPASESDTRKKLVTLIARRIFHDPPFWLQRGLERYFSDTPGVHPDQLRDVRASGKWLDLCSLIARPKPFEDKKWQGVYDVESACLVGFLMKEHPDILLVLQKGKSDPQGFRFLEMEWLQWLETSPSLIPLPNSVNPGPVWLRRALAHCLSTRVREGSSKILAAPCVLDIKSLEPCCKRDIARRKLLENYGRLVRIARMDRQGVTGAQQYVDCANHILRGEEFYGKFEDLERNRLENTAHQR